jgi:hypothetical protein
LETTARCADRIIEAAPQQTLASVAPPPENKDTRKYVEDLRHQVEKLHAELERVHFNSRAPTLTSRLPAPAPETAAQTAERPHETLHRPSAGTITDTEHRQKSVWSPAPTASRKTNTADINVGSCLHPKQRPPLRHG